MSNEKILEEQISKVDIMRQELYNVSQQLKLLKAKENSDKSEKKNWMARIYGDDNNSDTSDADIRLLIFNCTYDVAVAKTQITADESWDEYSYDVFEINEVDGVINYDDLPL